MALTVRGRRTAFDNIAVASATGRENTIAGETASVQEVYGGGYMVSTSNNERDITNIQSGGVSVSNTAPGPENNGDGTRAVALVGGTATDMDTTDPTNENTGSSNTAGFVTNP